MAALAASPLRCAPCQRQFPNRSTAFSSKQARAAQPRVLTVRGRTNAVQDAKKHPAQTRAASLLEMYDPKSKSCACCHGYYARCSGRFKYCGDTGVGTDDPLALKLKADRQEECQGAASVPVPKEPSFRPLAAKDRQLVQDRCDELMSKARAEPLVLNVHRQCRRKKEVWARFRGWKQISAIGREKWALDMLRFMAYYELRLRHLSKGVEALPTVRNDGVVCDPVD